MDNEKDPLAWEEVETEHLVTDEWMDFRRCMYRLPNGRVFGPFYTYSQKDYVVIVASDTEGKYLCERQFRPGISTVTTEFVAGHIEASDMRDPAVGLTAEDVLSAAKRELREETGYASDDWTPLLTLPSNASIADNHAYLFAARNCRKVSGQQLDDTEFLKVVKHSAEEIEEMIAAGRFQMTMHVTAWLLAQRIH